MISKGDIFYSNCLVKPSSPTNEGLCLIGYGTDKKYIKNNSSLGKAM